MSSAPSGWQPPKTNWLGSDPITVTDLNRQEGNVNSIELGNRTLDQALANPANIGTLRQILSWFAGRIRAINGAANWWEAPATTLATANTHHTATTAHGATAAPTANAIIVRDASGRAQVADGVAAGDIATIGQIITRVDLNRNFYDDYMRSLQLYYANQFSAAAIAGLRGMTFDGFMNLDRINSSASINVDIQTANRLVQCRNVPLEERRPVASVVGEGSSLSITNLGNAIDNNLGTAARYALGWSGSATGHGHMDLGQPFQIGAMRINAVRSAASASLRAEFSPNATPSNWHLRTGVTWTPISENTITVPSGSPVWMEQLFSSMRTSQYWNAMGSVSDLNGHFLDLFEVRFVRYGFVQSFLQSIQLNLPANILRVRLYASINTPAGTSVIPRLSNDGGITWISPVIAASRIDPLNVQDTEVTYEFTFPVADNRFVARFELNPTADTLVTPILRRYGVYWVM